nr:hypothetical protein wdlz-06GM53 [Ectropis obliqua nucleopolyhedrovirus]
MKKNTSFKSLNSNAIPLLVMETNYREYNEYDNVVSCRLCKFTAPLSLSYEEYLFLHHSYNQILNDDVTAASFGSSSPAATVDKCNLLKLKSSILTKENRVARE